MIVCIIMLLWLSLADLEDPVSAPSTRVGEVKERWRKLVKEEVKVESESESEDEDEESEKEVLPRRRSIRDRRR
jgi:hypothetical protein